MARGRTKDGRLMLSPSSIKKLEQCKAGYLFSNFILPRIDPKRVQEITKFGRTFHELAESGFTKEAETALLAGEAETSRSQIRTLAKQVQDRYYYPFESRIETHLSSEIRDLGIFHGFPDRICVDSERDKIIIVDYKTTAYPEPWYDRRQLVAYAYLLWRNEQIDPRRMELVLDYVKMPDPLHTFTVTEQELKEYENYLVSVFMKLGRLIEDFQAHYDIKEIPHTPGDCSFCPMVGKCIAYVLIENPTYDPINPEHITTLDLVKEYLERKNAQKLTDERLKALNQAIMVRLRTTTPDPDDHEGRSTGEIVGDYFTLVSSQSKEYPAAAVMQRLVPKRLKQALKAIPFLEMVDMQVVEKAVLDLVLAAIPRSLGASDVAPEDQKDVADLLVTRPKAAYLKQKG